MGEKVECRTCKKMFDPATKKGVKWGYVDECPRCSRRDPTQKYLGRQGNTGRESLW